MEPLNPLSQGMVGKRLEPVIDLLRRTFQPPQLSVWITLKLEIVDDFGRIEGQPELGVLDSDVLEQILKRRSTSIVRPGAGFVITHRVWTESKVARVRGKLA